jgi:hypothetical protein
MLHGFTLVDALIRLKKRTHKNYKEAGSQTDLPFYQRLQITADMSDSVK